MTTDQVAIPPSAETTHAHDAYAVKERVAIGTAGVVYRAVQRSSGKDVLFKVLMEQASHPLNNAQVLAVAPAIMRLKHPRIAELLDAYEDPEGTVLVYPLVPGMAGSEFPIKERLLTPAETRQVARQLCEALLAGERAAFPHGDVKPSNIVISLDKEDGGYLSVQLQDWGLSSCRTLQPPETMQFMAPERHHGHPTSAQGDLFSLGASLWFLMTGRVPVQSHTREALLEEWGAFDPGSLAGLQPEVDKHFSQWLGWLLRWQPRDRPPTVAKALEVLNQVISYVDATDAKTPSGGGEPSAEPAPAVSSTPASAANASAPALPAKPLAVRPSTARTERLRRGPGDAGPPTAAPPSAPTTRLVGPSAPAAGSVHEGSTLASKMMGALLTCCVLAAVGVLFVWWAEEEWGPDWRTEMTASLKSRLRTTTEKEPALATSTASSEGNANSTGKPSATAAPKTSSNSSGTAAAVAAKGSAQQPSPKSLSAKPAPKPTKPPTPSPGSSKPVSAVEPFDYPAGTTLDGANGGTGWKSPWKAREATKGKSADGKYQGVLLSGPGASQISRELAPGNTYNNGSVAVFLDLWHPGEGAAPLEFDMLGTADAPSDSAILIIPEGNRLKIAIKGGKEDLHLNAGAPLKLALKWSFEKKAEGKCDVSVEVFANPKPNASNLKPQLSSPLTGYRPPTTLTFSVRTTESASNPVILQKMRLAKTVKEAVK